MMMIVIAVSWPMTLYWAYCVGHVLGYSKASKRCMAKIDDLIAKIPD